MAEGRCLVDTSVLVRARQPVVGERLERLALAGRFWTCRVIDLEVLFATRANDVESVGVARRALPEAPISPATLDRALQVMETMASAGTHRAAKPVDLIIAAAAEPMGLTVLHYDHDYDLIAAVTGQSMEWVSPPGTLDR